MNQVLNRIYETKSVEDDDIWMPGIRKVLYFIVQNRDYEVVKTQTNENVGVKFLVKCK